MSYRIEEKIPVSFSEGTFLIERLKKLGLKTLVILILSILLGFLDAVGIISLIPLFKSLSIDELPKNDKFYQIFNIKRFYFRY